jgi:hypothetical protein
MQIRKESLQIDHSYQRKPIDDKVLSIARVYDSRLAGAILVARRCDGRMFIIDGGHRHAAAMRRSSIEFMDCIVIESTGAEMEAELFVKCNTMRKPVTAVEKFNAKCMYGDPVATQAAMLIGSSGRKIEKHAGAMSLSCVAKIEQYVRNYGEAFVELWPLIVELMQGEAFDCYLMRAITGLHIRLRAKEDKGAKRAGLLRWRDRVIGAGYPRLLAEVRKARAVGLSTDRQFGEFIVDLLDKRCRKPNLIRDILEGQSGE